MSNESPTPPEPTVPSPITAEGTSMHPSARPGPASPATRGAKPTRYVYVLTVVVDGKVQAPSVYSDPLDAELRLAMAQEALGAEAAERLKGMVTRSKVYPRGVEPKRQA